MIARVAESCFWLHRYMERVDNTARLLGVNFAFLLDMPPHAMLRWRPLLIVAGAEDDFIQEVGPSFVDDAEKVQEYLVWSPDNPVSIWNSLSAARENARTIRETLSLEAWAALNRFYLWLMSDESRQLYNTERPTFYERIRENCQAFHGVCHDTLLHEEPFEFMRLGMFIERASQVSRILDTKYHAVGPTRGDVETSEEVAEWIGILRSCSAYEPFFKRPNASLTGSAVAEFLLLDPAFPRSVLHCLLRASNFLGLIDRDRIGGPPSSAAVQLSELLSGLEARNIAGIVEEGLHEVSTDIVDNLAQASNAITRDYFVGDVSDLELGNADYQAQSAGSNGAGEQSQGGHPAPVLDRRHGQRHVVLSSRGKESSTDARILDVRHETVYTYSSPVQRSLHHFRLRPVDDERQDLIDYELSLSVNGKPHGFQDVFGNHVLEIEPNEPFEELKIHSRARVRVRGIAESERVDPSHDLMHPVVWMPWQRMMMLSYLMPPELPESQLSALSVYAHDVVRRNGGNVIQSLQDLNRTIHSDFTYEPGSTTVETTPYETFARRRGVCQDFAYLLICLAQLLNIPARYRVGYIYTGGDYAGQVSSDETHAWAEVYLPSVGWYGFDPANGQATGHVDYVRVATGRHYRDAAPVTGTIFQGGGGESLSATVKVELVSGTR